MALTGIDPNDPTPSTRRELIFGAGPSNTSGVSRDVLIIANKTSAGSETVNVITTAILDDTDAIARFGRRSEWYNMYRKYVAVDSAATIYGIAATESGGSAASADFTFTNSATDVSTVEITCIGEKVEATIASGDAVATVATAVAGAINAAAEGTWPISASAALGVVTVTAANIGPRGDLVIGNATDRGVRMRITRSCATAVAKGSLTAGVTEDDFTSAFAEMTNGEYYYQVSPKHSVTTVTSTDNGIGEHIETIKSQALPINGKSQTVCFGLVGTQAQATAVSISSAANNVRAFGFHAEDSDWTPGMLAAHHAAVKRSQEIAHPSANIAGYASTDNTVYQVPEPYNKNDRPTATEIRADLNNGVSPVAFTARGKPYLVRCVTMRSLNAQGNNDYRAREGHVTSAIDFAWDVIKARWESQKQPFVADDPVKGAKPLPKTSTPSQLKNLIFTVIDDLAGANPLGQYTGPILNPSKIDQMKNSVVVTRIPAGLSVSADLLAVEHNLKSEFVLREVSPAY